MGERRVGVPEKASAVYTDHLVKLFSDLRNTKSRYRSETHPWVLKGGLHNQLDRKPEPFRVQVASAIATEENFDGSYSFQVPEGRRRKRIFPQEKENPAWFRSH